MFGYSGSGPRVQALLVAHLDAAQIEHGVGHRDLHALALAGALALEQRAENAGDQMHAGAAVADLRAGDGRRPVLPAGRAGGAAHALRDIFIGLEIGVAARPEPLDRGIDDARVDLLDALPGKTLPVEHAGAEILDHHIAVPDQVFEDLLAGRRFQVERDAALVRVQHREIEAVGALDVAQLAARDVAAPRHLDFDHVGAHPGQQLRRGRRRLHVAHVENADAFESLAHSVSTPLSSRRQPESTIPTAPLPGGSRPPFIRGPAADRPQAGVAAAALFIHDVRRGQ